MVGGHGRPDAIGNGEASLMKRSGIDHPKVKALARRLGIPHCFAVGVAESMWHFTGKHAPAGNPGKYTNQDIADALGYPTDKADDLVAALVEVRLLDEHPTRRLVVHDWPDHCEDAVHMMLARQTQRFADGRLPSLAKFAKDERARIEAAFARADQAESVPPRAQASAADTSDVGRNGHGVPAQGQNGADEGTALALALALKPKPSKESAPSAKSPTGDAPAGLLALVDGWNALGRSVTAHQVTRDPSLPKAVLAGWKRAQRDPELRAAFSDVPRLVAAIGTAHFCHGQPWFSLAWLFTKNKAGEHVAVKLLSGGFKSNGKPTTDVIGPGQRHDPKQPLGKL
ncbi:MAG: hypothetical protein ACYC0Y_15565 [Pirellulales bacterium]